jgi:TRAP-type transport system periplasmic protein
VIRHALSLLTVASLMAGFSTAHADEPVQLRYGDPGSPEASIHTDLVQPWAEKVNKEGDGAVNVKVFVGYSLVNMVNTLDRVEEGIADMAFCILGPVSSQFPKTSVITLPFEVQNAHEGGLALQRLYDKGIIADEWQKVKPIAFGDFANLTYHTVRMVKTLDDLKGMKVSAQGRIEGQTLQALGGSPITVPINEAYESLHRGLVEGSAIGWPAAIDYKLTEIAKHHLHEALGGSAAAMIMNNATYARLSGKAKAVIDANIGATYTDLFNTVINNTEHRNIEKVEHQMQDQTVFELAPEERAKWKARIAPVIDNWVKNTPDGAHVLAAFRKELADIRTGS